MIKRVLGFFHYAIFVAVPVFLLMLFDGQLWPSILPNAKPDAIGLVAVVIVMTLMASLFVAVVRLAVDANYREACFSGLAGLRERDEREQLIVGTAARQTFLLSLAVLVALCFSSLFEISFNAHGLQQFSFEQGRADLVVLPSDHRGDTVVNVIPLTKTGVLVFLLMLQIGAFRYFSKRAASRH